MFRFFTVILVALLAAGCATGGGYSFGGYYGAGMCCNPYNPNPAAAAYWATGRIPGRY